MLKRSLYSPSVLNLHTVMVSVVALFLKAIESVKNSKKLILMQDSNHFQGTFAEGSHVERSSWNTFC
jgi:hypothetical protein